MKTTKKVMMAVIALVGTYVFAQLLADIGATKIVTVGKWVFPGGTFAFALTFTLRDMLHKRLGAAWARGTILLAGLLNIALVLYLQFVGSLQYPPFFELGEAWNAIFFFVPTIVVASIIAELVSEMIDTEIYEAVRTKFTGPWQFVRVLISNVVALPIDSALFVSLAFWLLPLIIGGEPLPLEAIMPLAIGQTVAKAAVTLVSLPLTYLVKDERIE